MCTVTVVAYAAASDGRARVRMVCNRDEQRSRARSTALVRSDVGSHTAVMPVDPQSGGTWIGANSAGVVTCLLNANPGTGERAARARSGHRSRGEIVPAVLAAESIGEAKRCCEELNPGEFPPFRLLILHEREYAIGGSDGESLVWSRVAPLEEQLMLTSSGLGDALVEGVRRELFEEIFARAKSPLEAQATFHKHTWADRTQLSVQMSRTDARTVSRTIVDVGPTLIALCHDRLDDAMGIEGTSRERLALKRAHARGTEKVT